MRMIMRAIELNGLTHFGALHRILGRKGLHIQRYKGLGGNEPKTIV